MKKKLFLATIFLVFLFAGCSIKQPNGYTRNKKITKHEVLKQDTATKSYASNLSLDTSKTDNQYIEELIDKYEKNICDAINMNDFSLVQNSLINGSSLYHDQKELVRDLWNQKINEAPVSHQIIKVQLSNKTNGEYKVYVDEKVAIKYPQNENTEVKEFKWIYTAIVDRSKTLVGLSDIEEWKN